VFRVAQIFNLPYRRFVIGGTLRPGDSWQVKNLRYGRLQVCATGVASKQLPVSRPLAQMPRTTMNLPELASLLVTMGCPAGKSSEMARQLDKRARQLAGQKGKTYEEAMAHLLNLMKHGWEAREKGHQP